MLLQYILFIFVMIANLVLGGIVLARKYNRASGWLFGVAILSISLWALGDMLLLGARELPLARLGAYFFYIAPMTIPVTLWLFSLSFPEESRVPRLPLWVGVAAFSVLSLVILMDLDWLVRDIVITDTLNIATPARPGFYIYAGYLGTFFTLTYISLLRKVFRVRGMARLQVVYTMFGALLAGVPALVTNLAFPLMGVRTAIWAGPVFSLASVYCVMVAMIRHRMFDIRLIVARSIAYVLSVAVLASGYGVVVFLTIDYAFDLNITFAAQVFISIATALVAITFPSIKAFFDRITSTIFYRDSYDPQEFIKQLNAVIVSTVHIDPLLRQAIEVIDQNLKCEFCIFGLKETKYVPQRIISSQNVSFAPEEILYVRSITVNAPDIIIVTEEIAESLPELHDILRRHDIEVLARLTTSHHVGTEGVGYMAIGPKKSGNPYTPQDYKMVGIVANELVIALENAMRYEEIERFNETLQDKITAATKKLQRTNEKLVQLDETKDEFISMASHQLRTPLTSIKGYLSMVLEGDAGGINPTQQKMLDQAFVSSQRMVALIADLLNVSRLKNGKFVIEPSLTNLAEVVKGEVAQLKETAAGRHLELTYEEPEAFPTLYMDETKTRQVIMNFVDNAIYYTPAGGHITVRLSETASSIEFTVTDDGIGVPKSEQYHLFTKFYRAGNARKARPDGTGLGLFMAKKVIVAQGGAVLFKSHPGKGSTFGFTFAKSKLQPPVAKS